jgi:hypothetical protein
MKVEDDMQPIYKSSALTIVVLLVLMVLRSFDIETQKVAYQFLILVSIATATLSAGLLATKYLTAILSNKKGSRKKHGHLGG